MMWGFRVAAGWILAAGLAGCEATLMSQRLDYHEMQGVHFTTDLEEDAVFGNPRIVHSAYHTHSFPVCAKVEGFPYVIVPSRQVTEIAVQSASATNASFEVGPLRSDGGC